MSDGRVGGAEAPAIDQAVARERLHKAAQDFEGVFLSQLFKEMRATIPTSDDGAGQELFTEMMDDQVAKEAARRSTRGIGEALYRQLAARLEGPATERNDVGNGGRT